MSIDEAILVRNKSSKPILLLQGIYDLDEYKEVLKYDLDFVIHSVWDKRSSDDKNNNGLHELFINGEKKLHYEGQNMWRKGGSLLEFGIYGSKDVRRYMGLLPNEEDVINVPRIAFYDEIWVKKSCEDLDLERLGYSCQNLFNQDDNVTKPDQADRPD